ncbi:putative glycoprotein 3-alpha-L-fucosyltransferase A-like [Apostichopus japonicus]|uniref:Fucosyltransferase n=1 Tax=Stichopus japonicus TaxID=307972 RepID=A0A2G8L700_STIJA|nr:putative glycoprotein 3-alpha-L-fucosyltransferase A-like [Apostichopus japonicus]
MTSLQPSDKQDGRSTRRWKFILLVIALSILVYIEIVCFAENDEDSFNNVLLPIDYSSVVKDQREIPRRNSTRLLSDEALDQMSRGFKEPNYIDNGCVKRIQIMCKPSELRLDQPSGKHFCPAENCSIIYIVSMSYITLKKMDAVLLYHKANWNWSQLQRSLRPPRQIWIYFGKEPPYKSSNWKPPDPTLLTFNWTMTYQRDSDIVFPYGKYLDSDPEIADNDNRNWAANKTRLIVWMSSNCKLTYWDRQSFVKKLKKLIAVDMYGACGTLTCPRGKGCDVLLSSYKFYLALENSQCKDYISEKFWLNAFSHQSIPIVYGTSIENYKSVAPPHSFIHLDEFSSMAALVKYIKYLDKNIRLTMSTLNGRNTDQSKLFDLEKNWHI